MSFVVDARYAGPRPSGIGNYVRGIGGRLPRLAPDARFHFWVAPGAEPVASGANVTHKTVRPPANGLATLLWPSRIDALTREDVFHGPANVLGFGLPCRAIVTVHDVMWIEHLDWCQPRPWLRPISRGYYTTGIMRALREAERILTVSNASADAIIRLDPSAKPRIVVTHNACEPHFRPPGSRDEARRVAARCLGTEAPFFLVVGQNQPSKGHAVALRAFAAAAPREHQLVLVQRLEEGRGLSSLARELGVEQRVSFVPRVALSDLLALLQSATALVHPSLAEGFGLPVLEAMASGCPVIGSEIPPLREILGDAGWLSAPGDAAALATSLKRAEAEPSALEDLRDRGLERARGFSWDRSAETTLAVYREVERMGPR